MLGKIAKISFIIAGILLLFLLAYVTTSAMDWPWWAGAFVLLGLFSLFFLFLFLRKLLARRREQKFVDQIIEQDNARLQSMSEKEREQSRALQQQWKEAIETLRKSHLRKQGNPLYVLPWYLVIGESGSGKTTAIKSARLSSPFATMARASGISGTKNCDWWFFEQAIILDTAGRYAIPLDGEKDIEEWKKFLNLLNKYRRKEPLNGVIVTVPADKLLNSDPRNLEEDGKNIRRRIDELMLALGTKFPVYILVTKCDLVQGMSQFCEHLPEKVLSQAMGLINNDFSKDAVTFQEKAIETVAEKLRDLRLVILHQLRDKTPDPGLLLFPEEFENLKSGLRAFVQAAFQENPYQETPLLRGLYFSSGRQEGTPYSHFLNALGLIEEKEVLPGTNKGLFLHDIFAKILPRDRGLFAPTLRAIEWSRLTRNLGMVSWITFMVALSGLLSFSFVKNLNIIRQASREFMKTPVLSGEVVSDVVTLDRFRQAILTMERQNRGWWIPKFGLTESEDVEHELKERFCRQFKKGFLDNLDQGLFKRLSGFTPQTDPDVLGVHLALLVRRINMLNSRLQGNRIKALSSMPLPPYDAMMEYPGKKILPEMENKLAGLYLCYLAWNPDTAGLNQEMTRLEKWLTHILTLEGANLHWLTAWANRQHDIDPVQLKDYWKGSKDIEDAPEIPPCYTSKGRAFIKSFTNELEKALSNSGPLLIAKQEAEFKSWYNVNYIKSWETFCMSFPRGKNALKDREEWQRTASKITKHKGPYTLFMERLPSEMAGVAGLETTPPWVDLLLYRFQKVKAEAYRLKGIKGTTSLGKLTSKGRKIVTRLETALGKVGKGKSVEELLEAAKAYLRYQDAIGQLMPVAASRKMAFEHVTKVFSEDPVESKSPFFQAQEAILELKSLIGEQTSGEEPFWTIFTGPSSFLWEYARIETACYLQSLWEKQVLVEIEDVFDRKTLNQMLFGNGGLVTEFAKGPASPFLSRSLKRGYFAVSALDGKIPFEPEFLTFLAKGAAASRPVRDQYRVTIKALPVDANIDAQIKPYATHLIIQCNDGIKRLDNFQYPVRKTIVWSPSSCGDVILEIDVADMKLVKKYTGYQAFAKFLRDFRTGQKIFYPKNFPGHEMALGRLGIKYIRVNYQFRGHRPVLRLLDLTPKRVPTKIAKCWD